MYILSATHHFKGQLAIKQTSTLLNQQKQSNSVTPFTTLISFTWKVQLENAEHQSSLQDAVVKD
jgi:hypothetical protein